MLYSFHADRFNDPVANHIISSLLDKSREDEPATPQSAGSYYHRESSLVKKELSLNLICLSLGLLSMFWRPAPLFGAVGGTPHDLSYGEQDACSVCHVQLKSFGEGLWPAPLNGEKSAEDDVYQLCYYCHGIGGGAGFPAVSQSFSVASEAGVLSHGLDSTRLPSSVDVLDPSLPYADDGALLCITCSSTHLNPLLFNCGAFP